MKQSINKAVKYALSNGVILFPFKGNLTNFKREMIAQKLANFLNSEGRSFVNSEKEFSMEGLLPSVNDNWISGVYKDIDIEYKEEFGKSKVNLKGKGWSISNHPQDALKIMEIIN